MADTADLRVKDAARAAALMVDAADGAPSRTLTTVDTALGRADVVVDGPAVDVNLHDRKATVHVRFDEALESGSDDAERG